MRSLLLALAVLPVLFSPALAAGDQLTEAQVRSFIAAQTRAWNARNLVAFAAGFTADAVFVDQARNPRGGVIPNGQSTRGQAIAQAQRFFARSRFDQTTSVERVEIAADGRSARVVSYGVTRLETAGRPPRTLCAETEQTLVLAQLHILSHGQTDTDVPCRR